MSPSCQIPQSPNGDDPDVNFILPMGTDFDVERLPPEKVRILEISAEPYPDGQRILVHLKMTPYQKRPHLEITLIDPQGIAVNSVSVIEPINWNLELTAHLRSQPREGKYTLAARLFYPPRDEEDPKLARIDIPVEDTDRRTAEFELPAT